MDEIISYKMCAVKVRNAKLRNYLNRVYPNLTHLVNFPCGRKPENAEKTHDFQQSVNQ